LALSEAVRTLPLQVEDFNLMGYRWILITELTVYIQQFWFYEANPWRSSECAVGLPAATGLRKRTLTDFSGPMADF
jgi:hypothetical protein